MIKKSAQLIQAISIMVGLNAAFAETGHANLYSFLSNPKSLVGRNSRSLALFLEKNCKLAKTDGDKLRGNYSDIYECNLDEEDVMVGINLQKKTKTTEYFALLAPEKLYSRIFSKIQEKNGKGYKIDESGGSYKISGWTTPLSSNQNVSLEVEIIKKDKKVLLQAHAEGNEGP